MNKINNTIANIHTELLNIIGECMHYDLSGDQLSKISDKKQELVKKLFDFIKKEGIDDLHWGNVGIRKSGAPVLLDYSGFNN